MSPSKSQGSENPQAGRDIDTVREILFGEDLRSLRSAMKAMESSFSQQVSSLRSEMVRAVEDLKKELSREIRSVGQNLNNEEKARIDACSALTNQLKGASADFDKRLQVQDQLTRESISSLNQKLENDLNRHLSEIDTKLDSIESRFNQFGKDLSSRKVESSQLSAMLLTLANTISGSADEPMVVKPGIEMAPPVAPIPEPPRAKPAPAAVRPAAAPPPPPPAQARAETAPPVAAAGSSSGEDLPGSDDFLDSMDDLFKLPKGGKK